MSKSGTLYVVATPIGNLGDITLRALEILRGVELIAAEDTRHSRKLLEHYEIKTKTISLHAHNEGARSKLLLEQLQNGKNVALISDAGTPLISDPGYVLVTKVRDENINVVPIPGASAVITALCASGLPTTKFIFEGFLPVKQEALRTKLAEFLHETRTTVIYESPHRLLKLINCMIEVLGCDRYLVLAKELSKIHETIFGAKLGEVRDWLLSDFQRQKGEFVLLLSGVQEENIKMSDAKVEEILQLLLLELPVKTAVNLAAKLTGVNRNKLYALAIKL